MDQRGTVAGILSYFFWGFFPIYWKLLSHVGPLEVLMHRVIWSFAFYVMILKFASSFQFKDLFKQSHREWIYCSLASVFLALNWGLYIYAVNTGHIIEGSLAYFINPLLNVVVGVLFFKESFPWSLRLAVGFALVGVAYRVYATETLPWISLVLAFSFCAYGIFKKLLTSRPQVTSVMESFSILLPCLLGAFYLRQSSTIELVPEDWMLFVISGAVTGLPLYLFSYAVQKVPYSFLGMVQFIAPSLQFLVGYSLYNEKVSSPEWISFFLIWTGAGLYLLYQFNKLYQHRLNKKRLVKNSHKKVL